MSTLILNQERCKACGYCVENCNKEALQFGTAVNKKGYQYVVNDPEKCTVCGLCYLICPDFVFTITE